MPRPAGSRPIGTAAYTGNPALYPLFASELPGDVVVVNINPLYREEVPVTARAIQNRINEISFQRLAPAGDARHRLRSASAGGRDLGRRPH